MFSLPCFRMAGIICTDVGGAKVNEAYRMSGNMCVGVCLYEYREREHTYTTKGTPVTIYVLFYHLFLFLSILQPAFLHVFLPRYPR